MQWEGCGQEITLEREEVSCDEGMEEEGCGQDGRQGVGSEGERVEPGSVLV